MIFSSHGKPGLKNIKKYVTKHDKSNTKLNINTAIIKLLLSLPISKYKHLKTASI